MKKKLALLLVLSMVLSMIPMNVFGAAADWAFTRRTVSLDGSKLESGKAVIELDPYWFVGTTGATIELSVDTDYATIDKVYGDDITLKGIGKDGDYATLDWEITDTDNTAPVTIEFTTHKDGLDNGDEVVVTANVLDDLGVGFPSAKIVVGKVFSASYSIVGPSSKNFSDTVTLGDFSIKENKMNAFTGTEVLRFKIDTANFVWGNTGDNLGVKLEGDRYVAADLVTTGDYKPTIINDGKELIVAVTRKGTGAAAGSLKIQNLKIASTDKSKAGDVKVSVDHVTYNTTDKKWEADKDSDEGTFTVAKLVGYELTLELDKDVKVAEVVSGQSEIETAKFVMAEVSPNSWGASRASETRFSVDEGVVITDAKVTLSDGDNKTPDDKSYSLSKSSSIADEYGISLRSNYLSVKPQLTANKAYTLTVMLTVSIEPGYVSKYDTDEIVVTVSGSAVAGKMKEDTIVVATVIDPIEVSVDEVTEFAPTQVLAGESVGTITIDETEAGALEQNKEVWVYLEGLKNNTLFTPVFNATAKADGNSGLRISKVTTLNLKEEGITGIKFTIDGESDEDPGYITIDGYVSGMVAGIDYNVVVSGSAVAENSYLVAAKSDHNDEDLFDVAPYTAPLFTFASAATPVTPVAPVAPTTPEAPVEMPKVMSYTSGQTDNGIEAFFVRQENPGKGAGYLSARIFAYWLGVNPTWDGKVATITAPGKDGSMITLELEALSNFAKVNGVNVNIAEKSGSAPEVPGVIAKNGNFYIPLRFAAETFGYKVTTWDPDSATFIIQ